MWTAGNNFMSGSKIACSGWRPARSDWRRCLDAELVPVLIVETSTWKYTIHFGSPVPQHYLGSPPDMQAIGTHLLQEFPKVITRHPKQCNMRLLRAMCPLPENGVADLAAVIQTAENP